MAGCGGRLPSPRRAHSNPAMVTLASLWLPILVSAVFVFIASSLIHMVLQSHNKDYGMIPDEDGFLELLRRSGGEPGGDGVPQGHPDGTARASQARSLIVHADAQCLRERAERWCAIQGLNL